MKKIWTSGQADYAEFSAVFYANEENATLKISACHNYAVYINGEFLANGQYADYPHCKSVDEIPFTAKVGKNEIFILASTSPEDYSTTRVPNHPFIAFEVFVGGMSALKSDGNVQSRVSARFMHGDRMSPQVGMGWRCDFTQAGAEYSQSQEIEDDTIVFVPRPIAKTKLVDCGALEVVAQGIFQYRGGETAAERMQLAWLSSLRFDEMTGENRLKKAKLTAPITFKAQGGDGIFIIFDLQRICAGYPSFTLTLEHACRGSFGWGEHLADLRIRTERAGRNFASEIQFAQGSNELNGHIRRIGCRYMCLFLETESVELNAISFQEELYPFKDIPRDFGDRLFNKIYEVGKRTLQLCAHEHYEDCPWREQALYGMDSRNQMLFGYSVFEEYELPRASMRMFKEGFGEDGLIPLCAPSRVEITIPTFSLYWVLAICENARVDYDASFVQEVLPYAERVIQTFKDNTCEQGVCTLPDKRYWNFHEWSDGLDGGEIFRDYNIEAIPDGAATALTLIVARELSALERRENRVEQAEALEEYVKALAEKTQLFFDTEKCLYRSYLNDAAYNYHGYTQALMLCAGVVSKEYIPHLLEELKNPKESVKMTYACYAWKYDAFMQYDENGLEICLNDICEEFGKMIFKGATTYWETENGEADFEDAGSLCHGWSSVACYVFERYLTDKNRKKEKKILVKARLASKR